MRSYYVLLFIPFLFSCKKEKPDPNELPPVKYKWVLSDSEAKDIDDVGSYFANSKPDDSLYMAYRWYGEVKGDGPPAPYTQRPGNVQMTLFSDSIFSYSDIVYYSPYQDWCGNKGKTITEMTGKYFIKNGLLFMEIVKGQKTDEHGTEEILSGKDTSIGIVSINTDEIILQTPVFYFSYSGKREADIFYGRTYSTYFLSKRDE